MKQTLQQGLAALAAAGLASSAWADLAQWVGCESSVASPCQPSDWAYSGNWVRQGLPQQPATGGPPLAFDVVRVTPSNYTTTPIGYVDTRSFNGGTPVFESLLIHGVTVTHSGPTNDVMRTLSLTIGDGGKYTFGSASGSVGLGGAFVPWSPIDGPYVPVTSAVIGSLNGSASFEHLGSGGVSIGAIEVPNNLVLGQDPGSSGQYLMGSGAGTLYLGFTHSPSGAASGTIVGQGGDGTFLQQGGSHVTGTLVLGQNAGNLLQGIPAATGTYDLSGSGVLDVRGLVQVGAAGTGTFTQSGGQVGAQAIALGMAAGSTGAYTMSGGSAGGYDPTGQGAGKAAIVVGDGGSGSFTQSGGNVYASSLTVGKEAGAAGTFAQTGGSVYASDLTLGKEAGAVGILTLDGTGSVVIAGNVVVGDKGAGQFDMRGGIASVTGNVVVAAQPGSTGTLNVSGGELGAANINVGAGGTLNYSGGAVALDNGMGKLTNANGGQVNVFSSSGDSFAFYGNVDNAGTIDVAFGSQVNFFACDNANSCTGGKYRQTGGATTVDGFLYAGALEFEGGALKGSGAITGNVVFNPLAIDDFNGTISPGNSPGQLRIDGNFSAINTIFNIEIGGRRAGLDYDQLSVIGDATIDGGLVNFMFIDGFLPNVGDIFKWLVGQTRLAFIKDPTVRVFSSLGTVDGVLSDGTFMVTMVDRPGSPGQVPEPGTLGLLALAGLGLVSVSRRPRSIARQGSVAPTAGCSANRGQTMMAR